MILIDLKDFLLRGVLSTRFFLFVFDRRICNKLRLTTIRGAFTRPLCRWMACRSAFLVDSP